MKTTLISLAGMLAIVGVNAQATPVLSSSAQIQNLSFEVVDLRPGDGVNATFATSTSTRVHTEAFWAVGLYYNEGVQESDRISGYAPSPFDGPNHSVSLPGQQASASRQGNDSSVSLAVQASSITDPAYRYPNGQDVELSEFQSRTTASSNSWVLSAGTEVRITGNTMVALDWQPHDLTGLPAGRQLELAAFTEVNVRLSTSDLSVFVGPSSFSNRISFQSGSAASNPFSQQRTQSFELVARNLGTTDIYFSLDTGVSNRGDWRLVGTVPEPESAALALAGLLAVAYCRRRVVPKAQSRVKAVLPAP